MKTKLRPIIIFILLNILAGSSSWAQENVLPEVIKKDMKISGGEYIVRHTVIDKKATLTIDNETVLLFEKDAFIRVNGGLIINGLDNAFINARSKDVKSQGRGFVFAGNSNTSINIDHVRFSHLQKPIEFEKNWLREKVSISNSIFKELNKNKVPIEIRDVDNLLIEKPLTVKIKSNTFSNNYSSILLTNISSDLLNYEIDNNVISQNLYFGSDQNGIFTSPMFVNYNSSSSIKEPSFKKNSFVFNFTSHLDDEKMSFYEPFMHIIGTGSKIDLSGNYLGYQSDAEIEETVRQIQADYEAPVIEYKKRSSEPDAKLNGHIYQVKLNDNAENVSPFKVPINETLRRVVLTANRPIQGSKNYKVQYLYMNDDTVNVVDVEHKLSYSNGYKDIVLDLTSKDFKNHPNGYLQVSGFYDINGYDVPGVTLGMFQFLKENRDFIMYFENLDQIPRKYLTSFDLPLTEIVKIDTAAILEALKDSANDEVPYPYKWDAGVFVGSTIYFGDLANTGIQFYLPNARPNVGFRLGYRLNQHIRLELAQNSMIITGSDDKDSKVGKSRGTNFERGLSFRTRIYDLGFNVEYQILRYKKISSIVPSIMVGVNGFYFEPEGKYEGDYIKLRDLGTEGQKLEGNSKYSKYSYSIPVGLKISRHLNKRNILCLSYTYHKLFTDYLDDVSTGEFQDSQTMNDLNPLYGPAAYELANPNGLKGQRSYSANYDGYSYWGFTWLYRF